MLKGYRFHGCIWSRIYYGILQCRSLTMLSQNQALEGCRPGRLQVTISNQLLAEAQPPQPERALSKVNDFDKDQMANSMKQVKNMNGGNTLNNYPLGLWSQQHLNITMNSTLHGSQGIQRLNIQNINSYGTTQFINVYRKSEHIQ